MAVESKIVLCLRAGGKWGGRAVHVEDSKFPVSVCLFLSTTFCITTLQKTKKKSLRLPLLRRSNESSSASLTKPSRVHFSVHLLQLGVRASFNNRRRLEEL